MKIMSASQTAIFKVKHSSTIQSNLILICWGWCQGHSKRLLLSILNHHFSVRAAILYVTVNSWHKTNSGIPDNWGVSSSLLHCWMAKAQSVQCCAQNQSCSEVVWYNTGGCCRKCIRTMHILFWVSFSLCFPNSFSIVKVFAPLPFCFMTLSKVMTHSVRSHGSFYVDKSHV